MFESGAPLSNRYFLALMSGISPFGISLDASGLVRQPCGDWRGILGLVNMDLSQPFTSSTRLPCSPVQRSFYLLRQPSFADRCELHKLAIALGSQSGGETSCGLLFTFLSHKEHPARCIESQIIHFCPGSLLAFQYCPSEIEAAFVDEDDVPTCTLTIHDSRILYPGGHS